MKTFIIFGCLIAISFATLEEEKALESRYLTVVDADGNVHVQDLLERVSNVRAFEREITINLYTQNDVEVPWEISSNNFSRILETDFDPTKKTRFIVHGWNNHGESPVNRLIKNALLDNYDVNVFCIDWSTMSYFVYPTARDLVPYVGQTIGDFITFLVNNYETVPSDFAIAGHSLGAHIAGIAGKVVKENLEEKIDHIVAMDPAKPLFYLSEPEERVNATDADYVQVIHSSGMVLGFFSSLGHSDYFPNGGLKQNGCGIDFGYICSHNRAYEYYAESIATAGFKAKQCVGYSTYKRGECDENPISYMGTFDVDKTATGDYFLETNSDTPFAKE